VYIDGYKKLNLIIFIGILINIALFLLKFNNPFEKYTARSEIGVFLLVVYGSIIIFVYKKIKTSLKHTNKYTLVKRE